MFELAAEQNMTFELVRKVVGEIRRVKKGSEPLPQKRVKKDLAQAVESFSSKVDAIAETVKVVSSLSGSMESIKDDLRKPV